MTEPSEAEVQNQLAETEALADSLEAAVLSGDTTVSHEELTRTRSLASFLRLQVAGAKKRAEDAREIRRAESVKAIGEEIREQAPRSAKKLQTSLAAFYDAAQEFMADANENDTALRDWKTRLNALGVTTQTSETGVGFNGIDQLVIDSVVLEMVDGGRFLDLVLDHPGERKSVPTADVDRKAAVFAQLGATVRKN